jgi:hypothetical protein
MIYFVSKSQMIISAGNPGKVFWALAMYFPFGEILIAELLKKYMRFYYRGLLGRFDFWRGCVLRLQLSLVDKQYANYLDEEGVHHRYVLKLANEIPEKPMTALISISFCMVCREEMI